MNEGWIKNIIQMIPTYHSPLTPWQPLAPAAENMEVLDEDDGSETMEDAIGDAAGTTPLIPNADSVGDRDGAEDSNSASTKKRVHFADDTDGSIFR